MNALVAAALHRPVAGEQHVLGRQWEKLTTQRDDLHEQLIGRNFPAQATDKLEGRLTAEKVAGLLFGRFLAAFLNTARPDWGRPDPVVAISKVPPPHPPARVADRKFDGVVLLLAHARLPLRRDRAAGNKGGDRGKGFSASRLKPLHLGLPPCCRHG